MSPMTDSDITVHFPYESDFQSSTFSDVFARVESTPYLIISEPMVTVPVRLIKKQMPPGNSVRLLLTRRNALSPISLLPAKILARHANDLQKLVQGFHWDKNEGLFVGSEDSEDYKPDVCNSVEDFIIGHGSSLLDWDSEHSEGLDKYSLDRW
ncbi:hypothetical protein F5888DRAFT_1906453 [Russula emetica]|nr:hypothetical protein F5888DRAFT_1906453 [Russula emetica]